MISTGLMKKILAIFTALICCLPSFASHIRGGEMYYKYIGPGIAPNSSKYTVTLELYVRCDATQQQLDDNEPFTVFTKADNRQFGSVYNAPFINEIVITYDPMSNPCISNPPTDICYRMRFYETTIELPDNPNGYTIALQRCCRIAGIENIAAPSDNYGATYSCDIPGTNTLPLPEHNSSPIISGNDAVAICTGSYFTYDFSAKDPDNDSLVYALCDAYQGGGRGNPLPNPSSPPPFLPVPYQVPYSGGSPLGLKASINPSTGIISGIAPPVSAQYVVTACVSEYRHGKLINVHRKDIHLRIADCIPLKAMLKPDYSFCDNFLVSFQNEQVNPAGSIYIWQYGDGTKADTSRNAMGLVSHQYADTGTYTVKLEVILAGQCLDSTRTLAKVYPGFFPGFISTGTCLLNPIQFTDTTKSRYGAASFWRWNFGDETTAADTSHAQNPAWKYSTTGVKTVQLIVQSNKGCIDTVSRTVEVKDKPIITLAFKDTLICSNPPIQDTLQLQAGGLGFFSWTPNTRISGANTPNPFVYPASTTTYYVQLNENGCINNDSVRVRTVDHVTLTAGPDTTICLTDPVTLYASGDGQAYSWSPAASLDNPNSKNPVAIPPGTTTYQVMARIGKCNKSDNVTIITVPYPGASAGPDTTICYADTAQLNGSIKGSRFNWSPLSSLLNPTTLTPLAHPLHTTSYILTVYDNIGCPKPGRDTVVVNVRPPVIAFAGNDTAVVVNQPLKLFATGAEFYLWTPPDFLDRNDVQSPVALFTNSGIYTYMVKAFTPENCFSTDSITIKVFKTAPDIFVPNAFTPGRTQNDLFRPIPVGIARIDYFRVYNRWGQLVFSSVDPSRGWDGTIAGRKQDAGAYVWVVQGRDFTGKLIFKKGTMVLIR
jgi:PKD repeat protein